MEIARQLRFQLFNFRQTGVEGFWKRTNELVLRDADRFVDSVVISVTIWNQGNWSADC